MPMLKLRRFTKEMDRYGEHVYINTDAVQAMIAKMDPPEIQGRERDLYTVVLLSCGTIYNVTATPEQIVELANASHQ